MAKSGDIVSVSFRNCALGVNTLDPGSALRDGELAYAQNMLLKLNGAERVPGYVGLAETQLFTTYLKGLFTYLRYTGTEYVLAVSNGKLYSINESTGAKTELYDITGTGEAWGVNFLDKFWVCNGTDVVKVEATTAYKVGMAAPTGATSALVAGGSLDDGVYQIYLSHTRKVDGTRVLHSVGQSVTSRTCGSGNNTIRITFSDASASDAQITHVTVWMTDAGGSTYYYYGEAAIDAGTVDITSDSNKLTTLDYNAQAANNTRPPALQWIHVHGNRLFGGIDNAVYYSLQAASINSAPVYDLEKWPQAVGQNLNQYPFNIDGAFSIGDDLFFNTPGGIIRQPGGNMAARYVRTEERLYFKSMRTVRVYNGVAWGLTNDGFRYFDGQRFSPDLSKKIRREIDDAYTGDTTHFHPAGEIVRRSRYRTEYILSFRDIDLSSTMNNFQAVLNLDLVSVINQAEVIAPWEFRTSGFGYSTVKKDNTIYYGQSLNGNSTIFKERTTQNDDKWVYNSSGSYYSSDTSKRAYLTTRSIISNLAEMVQWVLAFSHIKNGSAFSVKAHITDNAEILHTVDVSAASDTGFVLDEDILDINAVGERVPLVRKHKMSQKVKGRGVYFMIDQTANDTDFNFIDLEAIGEVADGRFV